jgi:hypothetical protein
MGMTRHRSLCDDALIHFKRTFRYQVLKAESVREQVHDMVGDERPVSQRESERETERDRERDR